MATMTRQTYKVRVWTQETLLMLDFQEEKFGITLDYGPDGQFFRVHRHDYKRFLKTMELEQDGAEEAVVEVEYHVFHTIKKLVQVSGLINFGELFQIIHDRFYRFE